jgi:hypothetical protein
MRDYESPGSRVAFGIVAVTMAAATIALLVLLPARIDNQQPVMLTASAQDATVGAAPVIARVREAQPRAVPYY